MKPIRLHDYLIKAKTSKTSSTTTPKQEQTVESSSYQIRWLINAVRLGKKGKKSISLAFCEKTKQVAFIATGDLNKPCTWETIKPLTIHDVYVANNTCEDSQVCWCLECPLNKASPKKLSRYGIKTQQDIEKMSIKLQQVGKELVNQIDWNKPNQTTVYKTAPFTIIKTRK